ncbi:FAD-dependent oxidoreductase [Vibrio sp. SS-MA-C1-2]|nr:FAD-dependent oxidoreductase [Vibrio sp. SS-MA-C1-2]
MFRSLSKTPLTDKNILGEDYWSGESLVIEFLNSDIMFYNQSSVWNVSDEQEVFFTKEGVTQVVHYQTLILATGAIERTVPFSGWELPGVLTAGAGQILLKDAGTLVEDVVLVGSGPLLDVLANQYVQAGYPPKAIIDTTVSRNYISALSSTLSALKGWRYMLKGFKLKANLYKAGIKRYYFAKDLTVSGADQVETISFRSIKKQTLTASHVMVHFGVIPNINICHALGLKTQWDASQMCHRPVLNEQFLSTRKATYVIGDAQGISGAKAAQLNAQVAMATILQDSELKRETEKQLRSDVAIRPFLEALFKIPPSQITTLPDDTVMCKCEAVKIKDIKQSFLTGSTSLNDLKVDTRCGMGACQGRQCGNALMLFSAAMNNQPISEVEYYKIRTPIVPVTFKEMSETKY